MADVNIPIFSLHDFWLCSVHVQTELSILREKSIAGEWLKCCNSWNIFSACVDQMRFSHFFFSSKWHNNFRFEIEIEMERTRSINFVWCATCVVRVRSPFELSIFAFNEINFRSINWVCIRFGCWCASSINLDCGTNSLLSTRDQTISVQLIAFVWRQLEKGKSRKWLN